MDELIEAVSERLFDVGFGFEFCLRNQKTH